MNLYFKKLHEDAIIPEYFYLSDSGFDLYAVEDAEIKFGEITLIHTGLAIEMASDGEDTTHYEMQIRPKSGLALKEGITVVNSPGTVDFSYRGEICVIASTLKKDCNYKVNKGDKIAQGVICAVIS